MSKNALFLLGLFASIGVAVAGGAKDLPSPWDKILSLGGLAGTAITGYLAQRPRDEWTPERRAETRTERDTDRLLEREEE
jgi:hypothetical protein